MKQTHERARGQGRIPAERLGRSLSVIAEVRMRDLCGEHLVDTNQSQVERRASESKQEYDHCSKLIKTEVARFEQERIEDFKNSLQVFLEEMISRQKEVSGHLALHKISHLTCTARRYLGELPAAAAKESRRTGSRWGCPMIIICRRPDLFTSRTVHSRACKQASPSLVNSR